MRLVTVVLTVLGSASTILMPGCCDFVPAGPGTPQIELTVVPPINTAFDLRGRVAHVTTCDHRVAVYIFVDGGWWTKPTFAAPVRRIGWLGDWSCDITTGGNDPQATRIAAFLIPASYEPPLAMGTFAELPAELEANSLASVEVTRP